MISNTGYLSNSPDRFNRFNIIPSKNITMKGVPHPVLGVDNKGNIKLMTPGNDYKFKGDYVTEIPLRNTGRNLQHGVLQNGGDIKIPNRLPEYKNRFANYKPDINQPGEAIKYRDDFAGNFISPLAEKIARSDAFPAEELADEQGLSTGKRDEMYGDTYDLFRYYFGQPLQSNTLSKSKYKPTLSKDKNASYISINDEEFQKQVLDLAYDQYLMPGDTKQVSGYRSSLYNSYIQNDENRIKDAEKRRSKTNAIGNFIISKGRDEKGTYISYYDKFDIGTGNEKVIDFGSGKPFEIYDRIYIHPKTGQLIQKQNGGDMKNQYEKGGRTRNKGTNLQHGVLQDGGENKYIPSLNNRGPSQRESIGEAMWDGAGMALGAVGDVMSIPQRYIMQGLTGKYQDPSQAWGFKEKSINPTQFAIPGMGVVNTNQLRDFSNFAMDTVLDPMNLLGASVIKSMFKGVKSGSIAARGAKSADNFIPKSVIDDGYRNMFQKMKTDPDFISKADPNEVLLHNAENQIKLARNLDASEILSKGDRSIDKGLRDSYEAIKYTDINKLPDSLKKFKGLSFEDYQSHFIKDQPFSQVASKIAPDLEYSPVFRANQEINKPLTDELYNSLRNENINPFKRNIYTENTGNALHKNTVREMNSFESDKIDAVNSFNKVRNETGVIRSGTSDAIDWNALRYKNKNGGEIKKYQNAGEYQSDWSNPSDTQWTQQQIGDQLEEMGPPGERPGLNIYNENLRRPPIDNTIKFPSTGVPGVQGRPEPTTEYESFMPYSMYGLMGLGALNNVLDKRNKQFYAQQMQKYGNTNAMQTNNPENPYGDFTLNNSVGSNFRPNQYAKRGGSVYQEGGEYDLTEEEIHMLQNEGYDIEFL